MSLLDKFKDQFVDHDEEDEDLEEEDLANEEPQRPVSRASDSVPVPPSRVMRHAAPAMSQAKPYTMIVVSPKTYSEAEKIADHLKSDRPVIMNLEKTDADEAQRIVDFIQGIMYALDGRINPIAESIYLCAPHNMSVSLENYTPYESEDNKNDASQGGAPQWNPQSNPQNAAGANSSKPEA
jgi:cell division inhibitor SepF